ncbi:LacI family DNA-binding transcriptional regulator [Rhizobium sp. BK251]|uniref:LacI family DNA-binding transcriptional regulator n=1 Tax=Rhizobium sp. BK251 TaxID=2512125 RepID=UPI001053AEBE|nr:LacI family DNA-binding transcriptional regulator [Rhizobium sp. BK251]TCL68178.1 LacI family transcriptional regulator [Rhizobium sp. BK251]
MTRVTLQEIADHLGISKFAVSRALTGKPGVSDDTRRIVLNAAEQFGYTARRNRTVPQSIEVIFHDRTVANRELWIDVQHGIEMEATRFGCTMAVRWTDDHHIIDRLEASTLGFILVGPQEPRMFDAARDSVVPSVVVAHVVPELYPMDQITATDVEAGVSVAKFLYGLGHRRLVYVHGQLGYPGRYARLRGFSEATAELQGAELREISFKEDYMAADFRDAVMKMAKVGFEPTAFFCGSDGVAVTVVSELMRMGISVPYDVSVVGHADYPIATQVSPNLTTVHMPHKQMGVAAVRQLLSRLGMNGQLNDLPAQRVSLVPHLVVRQSSAEAPKHSWLRKLSAELGHMPGR